MGQFDSTADILTRRKASDLIVSGMPFRVWVAQRGDSSIEEQLPSVGTNAIPHFIRILRERDEPAWLFRGKQWLFDHVPRKLFPVRPVPVWKLKRTAIFGLRAFGSEAKIALPEVIGAIDAGTNRSLRAIALNAALKIAPQAPETFAAWRREWEGTNFSRRDLLIYLQAARVPIPAAVPILLRDLKTNSNAISTLEAFEFFGEYARPAVPFMRDALRSSSYRGNVIKLIQRLGPVAGDITPVLAPELRETNIHMLISVLEALKSIGPAAIAALPEIRPLLTNHDGIVRMLSATAQARIANQPELAFPILLDALEGRVRRGTNDATVTIPIRQNLGQNVTSSPTDASALLVSEFGPSARVALPRLESLLEEKSQSIQLSAAQAITRIGGDTRHARATVLKILNSCEPGSRNEYSLIRGIEILEDMGPDARDAVPTLVRVRSYSMKAYQSARAALTRINGNIDK